jgi:hypothetical protein
VQLADLEAIAGPYERRRTIFFDHRRTRSAETRYQRFAMKNLRVEPSAGVSNIHAPRMCRLWFRRARQARDLRLL